MAVSGVDVTVESLRIRSEDVANAFLNKVDYLNWAEDSRYAAFSKIWQFTIFYSPSFLGHEGAANLWAYLQGYSMAFYLARTVDGISVVASLTKFAVESLCVEDTLETLTRVRVAVALLLVDPIGIAVTLGRNRHTGKSANLVNGFNP